MMTFPVKGNLNSGNAHLFFWEIATVYGGFHLVAKIIRKLKSHMIPYEFKCSHSLVEITAFKLESKSCKGFFLQINFPRMRALEFIRDHVTFKLPYDFSYHMKTPYITLNWKSPKIFIFPSYFTLKWLSCKRNWPICSRLVRFKLHNMCRIYLSNFDLCEKHSYNALRSLKWLIGKFQRTTVTFSGLHREIFLMSVIFL